MRGLRLLVGVGERTLAWSTQGEAELGAEALGVAAEGEQRVGGGGEEQIEEQAAVAANEWAQQGRQGEHAWK